MDVFCAFSYHFENQLKRARNSFWLNNIHSFHYFYQAWSSSQSIRQGLVCFFMPPGLQWLLNWELGFMPKPWLICWNLTMQKRLRLPRHCPLVFHALWFSIQLPALWEELWLLWLDTVTDLTLLSLPFCAACFRLSAEIFFDVHRESSPDKSFQFPPFFDTDGFFLVCTKGLSWVGCFSLSINLSIVSYKTASGALSRWNLPNFRQIASKRNQTNGSEIYC